VAARAVRGNEVAAEVVAAFEELLAQRTARVPLQHLTGRAPFRTLDLAVGPGVFVPRPETEVVAGVAIDEAIAVAEREPAPVVVDLCTGSGAVALAVAVEVPSARVVAVELDPMAHAWAARNVAAIAARVDLRLGDAVGAHTGVLADLAGAVAVVVANPPYIPPGSRPVDPEVADHDPPIALYGGGDDGLAVPRGVVASAVGLLRSGGLLVMEHADGQGAATRALVGGPGWRDVRTVEDLTGRARALVARRQ
jgi:release factor glutamine methyltransferase